MIGASHGSGSLVKMQDPAIIYWEISMGRLIHKFGVDFIDDSNMNEFLHDDSIFSTYLEYCIGPGWQRDCRGDSLVSNSIMFIVHFRIVNSVT